MTELITASIKTIALFMNGIEVLKTALQESGVSAEDLKAKIEDELKRIDAQESKDRTEEQKIFQG